MVFFELTATRAFTVYGAQGILFAFLLFLAYKILNRDRKRLNIILSLYYLSVVIGLLVNFVYAPIEDDTIVRVLNFFANFFIFFAAIFLVIFELILLKSEKVITFPRQLLIILLYGIPLFCMILFVFVDGWGVTLNEDGAPIWSFPFFIYLVLVVTLGMVIPTLYFALQVSKKFEDEFLRKRWKFFIIGVCALFIFMYGIFISNTLDIPIVRTAMGGLGLILAIAGGYLIYYGVGKSIEK
ncbi:hypothetical protein LCGC14_0934410 [marine sediment metagenome]|uniref:Histidine kinase N-terminal 7TM region domain-containing protein n=1 Tax=marine sediment metagenome TaxID=412755 RepID=A0A0F9R5H4_9ZZZZ|nr:MAG: hypothetical protein Lokiarch_49070 [Candidatus Lokiarchaeum sp. GC14_75]